MRDAPHWWDWDFVVGDHVRDRMIVRNFNEVELLEMIEQATEWLPSQVVGRFVLRTRIQATMWEVVVEPDEVRRVVDVVTAYESD